MAAFPKLPLSLGALLCLLASCPAPSRALYCSYGFGGRLELYPELGRCAVQLGCAPDFWPGYPALLYCGFERFQVLYRVRLLPLGVFARRVGHDYLERSMIRAGI